MDSYEMAEKELGVNGSADAEQGQSENAAIERLAQADANDMQRQDEFNSWIDASAFVQDYGNQRYHVLVWMRGSIYNDFELQIDGEGAEIRTYPHWLINRGGKRATREELIAENFSERAIRYNLVSTDIEARK